MSANYIQSSEDVLKCVKGYFSDDWVASFEELPADNKLRLTVYTEVFIDKLEAQKINVACKAVAAKLQGTTTYRGLEASFQREFDELQDKIKNLKTEIEHLGKYKTYYDMQFTMQHGAHETF